MSALTALAVGCTEPDVRRPKSLAVLFGDAQVGEVGAQLPTPIEVQVVDSFGRAVPHVFVTFQVTTVAPVGFSPGAVNPPAAETNESGVASTRWTLGTQVGRQSVRASIGSNGGAPTAATDVSATAYAGPAASMARVTDSLIAITVGDSAQIALVAKDRFGNAASIPTAISWQVRDPEVAAVSGAIVTATGPAATVVARRQGTTVLEVSAAGLGPVPFELRTYVRPGRDLIFASFTDETRRTPGIFLLPAHGGPVRQLTQQYAADPAWSPDGRRIAFTGRVGQYSTAIFVMNADGSGVRMLTDTLDVGSALEPSWSPDGQKIAFVARAWLPGDPPQPHPVRNALFVMNADGSSPKRLVLPDYALCRAGVCTAAMRPAWSPDGTRIAYAFRTNSSRSAFGAIFVVNPDGSGLRQLPTGDVWTTFASEPAWSPDGGRLVFARAPLRNAPTQFGRPELYVVGADGTGLAALATPAGVGLGATSAAWAPGELIAFNTGSGWPLVGHETWATVDLFVANPDGSEPRRVANVAGGVSRPAWRPGP